MRLLAEDDRLVVTLEGMEMLWGMRHRLVLPRENIVDLVWTPEYDTNDLLLRIGGANMPRVLLAGNFRDTTSKETMFLYLRRPKGFTLTRTLRDTNVLSVTMRHYPYAKVIVNCDPETGASLMNWFSLSRGQHPAS